MNLSGDAQSYWEVLECDALHSEQDTDAVVADSTHSLPLHLARLQSEAAKMVTLLDASLENAGLGHTPPANERKKNTKSMTNQRQSSTMIC